jgi:hypothetical protein
MAGFIAGDNAIIVTGRAAVLVLSLGGLTPGLPVSCLVLSALLESLPLVPEKAGCKRRSASHE